MEFLPKSAKERETRRRSFLDLYLPFGELRKVEPHNIDPAVEKRIAANIGYKPANM